MSRLQIGITCYPTYGGSGIIATEVGLALARRGHQVHFICTDLPMRLDPTVENVWFHPVRAAEYPVFPTVPYSLALASRMVEVSREHDLDVLHTHYAVPHATSGWMATEILGEHAPRLITTLHGTDITLVGGEASYLPITRHSIARSAALTAPSTYLRDETWSRFELDPTAHPIAVIPNFVDPDEWHPRTDDARPELAALFGEPVDGPVLAHTSNFRPVKRVSVVVDVFERVADAGARLVLVGDGPDRPAVAEQLERRGLSDRAAFAGTHPRLPALLRECDVFLLPSASESFGLAALEASSSGVVVVASDVGGLPEVLRHGETGFLVPPDSVEGFAASVRRLIEDPVLRSRVSSAARSDVLARFQESPVIDQYEELYRHMLADR